MTQPKRWQIAPTLTAQANESLVKFPPILRQVLFNRGYASDEKARAFLKAETDFDTDPFQMTGMNEAVERIRYAIELKEPIVVYGDYDVDGVSATALLVQTLQVLGGNSRPYIPNRMDEGYGLNPKALDLLKADGVGLAITVDSGIRSPAEALHARSIGLDLIISDHHQPAEGELPYALALINPKQTGDRYPEKDLAGVGVAYKLAQALFSRIEKTDSNFQLEDLLDLVALGTVADLVPLVGENRVLVRKGLQKIHETKRQGLFSLAAVSDLVLARTTAISIGFILGPRLNAAGRLESALAAYDLLTTTNVKQAGELSQQLNNQNRLRQELTRKIQYEAEAIVQADDPASPLLFAVSPEFNSGVVGLAAARLVETYYRPAVVGQIFDEEGITRCSCRSIPEFQITQALDQCKDLLIRYGGHAAAAGFTVSNENLEELKKRLKSIAEEKLGSKDLRQTLNADAVLPLSDLRSELLSYLDYLQPTGYGNQEAVFVTRNVRVTHSRAVGVEGKHLKLSVTDGHVTLDAIGFRLGYLQAELPLNVDLMYTFESNDFNGRRSLQLNLRDVRTVGAPD
ncbi:MAG: single-stranded-DNA-specific exonuclease RecJ [Anaerolineales bacterium]|jgi:single-stranded-DNA-specific exonuclease